MSDAPSTAVLSERIEEAIGGRAVDAAVFTTFRFEPGFFEEEVLPTLFDQSFSHVAPIRLGQLEDRLKSLGPIAVYYDRQGLMGGGSASLDVARIGMGRPTGYFHPKVILVLVSDLESGENRQSLVTAFLSANLTRAGWWENVEGVVVRELRAGQASPLRDDLLRFLDAIAIEEGTGQEQAALAEIRGFLQTRVPLDEDAEAERLWSGETELPRWLRERVPGIVGRYNLEVISPYLDATGELGALGELIETLQPLETRVSLPFDDEGRALCHERMFAAVEDLESVHWSELPGRYLQRSKSGGEKVAQRFVHAKIYRIWSKEEGRELLLVGSPNLTRPAHSRRESGNLECAILFETGVPPRDFWLHRLEREAPPVFAEPEESREETEAEAAPLTVRFDWKEKTGACFWEGKAPSGTVDLFSEGTQLARLEGLLPKRWIPLPEAASKRLERWLLGSSYLEVRIDGEDKAILLVREEGMAKKPSILVTLSPAEILQYWSLLSAEQREAFLAERKELRQRYVEEGLMPPSSGTTATQDTFFDRFAGIFHAFGRFEKHVIEALTTGREKDAVYRLFGEKYDSLPALIRKVAERVDETEAGQATSDLRRDPVARYVTLLTARQLIDRLEPKHPEFFAEHPEDLAALRGELEALDALRDSFEFDTPDVRRDFLAWFEGAFLAHPEVSGDAS